MIQINCMCMGSAVPLGCRSLILLPSWGGGHGRKPLPRGESSTRISGGGGWTQEDGKHGRLWGLLGLN